MTEKYGIFQVVSSGLTQFFQLVESKPCPEHGTFNDLNEAKKRADELWERYYANVL
jgi:hypothetical protein